MTHPQHTPQRRRTPLLYRIKRLLPRSLFGRTLIIIVLPTLITLAAATYVFFDRHWYTVTSRLSYAVAGDIALVVDLIEKSKSPEETSEIVHQAQRKLDLVVSFKTGSGLTHKKQTLLSPYKHLLKDALHDRLQDPFEIDMQYAPDVIAVSIATARGVFTVLLPDRRIYTPTTEVFVIWMTGSSIVLSLVALLFMRNQIRPIRRLADAAEAIGKGREVPWFKIEGAAEVRQAAAALMVMRDRLKRQITQRTAMLAGVSHDLRTPLTRMKLQLEMMPQSAATQELTSDVSEMGDMLEAYLAFARGDEAEATSVINIGELLGEIISSARRQNFEISLSVPQGTTCTLRRNAIKRCLMNLVSNAMRYAKRAELLVVVRDHAIDIMVDDDGPGIPHTMREEVFRPFMRLDESRNPTTGGVGLGLTIARDIARFHGGDIVLEDSPLGGLRAHVWLPT